MKKSAGLLGAAAGMGALPGVIQRALAIAPHAQSRTIQDVRHVVILMQENRSFDHYFGTLRGVRGFGDRFPIPLESGQPVWFESDGNSNLTPFHLDSKTTNSLLLAGTPHNFSDAQAAWNQGKFGRWPLYKTGLSMGHYRREDIPFQFALAESFTICDAYHCSLTTCTDPNRIVFFSGANSDPARRRDGIGVTDQHAEVTNLRCAVGGRMPAPGYRFTGSALSWPTIPELLQEAGIDWRIYEDPNDNWNGLMHGCLAFESFRSASLDPSSPLYRNGLQHWSIEHLRNDVLAGTLPSVSWILPTPPQSEHPGVRGSPARAGDFITQILEALTADPVSWSETVFFVTYDENDGFFDHAPPPAVPSINADGTPAGKSTVSVEGEYFFDPQNDYRLPGDTISGPLRPWGLGARVPMFVISPWSRGGLVNSQVFDHTSIGMFLEKRFGITIESITPWRRAVCGDLTSAFDFNAPDYSAPTALPDVSNFAALEAAQAALPAPDAATAAATLFQEPGTRPSRALPYELHASARATSDGLLTLLFGNSGTQGAVFHVYDLFHLDRIPRRYTVEAGKLSSDTWDAAASDGGNYQLWVYGPNGFVRSFQGNTLLQSGAAFRPEIQVCFAPADGLVCLKVHNAGGARGSVQVRSNAYRVDGPWIMQVDAASTTEFYWDIKAAGNWYDFTVVADYSQRRFAGRMETGTDSVSDPALSPVALA